MTPIAIAMLTSLGGLGSGFVIGTGGYEALLKVYRLVKRE